MIDFNVWRLDLQKHWFLGVRLPNIEYLEVKMVWGGVVRRASPVGSGASFKGRPGFLRPCSGRKLGDDAQYSSRAFLRFLSRFFFQSLLLFLRPQEPSG